MATPCPTDKAAADGEVSPLTEPSCGGVSAALLRSPSRQERAARRTTRIMPDRNNVRTIGDPTAATSRSHAVQRNGPRKRWPW
mmetsp:Transcript_22553/g.48832  ORF Transcript_22553/g.48832 Transcript_22553/m.48832 type:complete len:83 (-) Transcript_22553:268-516(-)